MLNKYIGIGNLGANPIIRKENNLATFTLATTEKWKDKQGNKQTRTEWLNVVVFGKQSEILEKYVKKGDRLYIEGKLRTDTYEKDGQTKYITKIICDRFIMLGGKNNQVKKETSQTGLDNFDDIDDDSLPF